MTAPTLYHHFGSKQNLLDEVVRHGYLSFLSAYDPAAEGADPRSTIAAAWDAHVRFGVEHPAFYAHIYGRVEPGYRCGVLDLVEATLRSALGSDGISLTLPASDATKMILAATSGVIITLIGELDPKRPDPDYALSTRVRDAILDTILSPRP